MHWHHLGTEIRSPVANTSLRRHRLNQAGKEMSLVVPYVTNLRLTLLPWAVTRPNALYKAEHQTCEFRVQTGFKRLKDVPLSYVNTKVELHATALWKTSTQSASSFSPEWPQNALGMSFKLYMKPESSVWCTQSPFPQFPWAIQSSPGKSSLQSIRRRDPKSGALVSVRCSSPCVSPCCPGTKPSQLTAQKNDFPVGKALLTKLAQLARLAHTLLTDGATQAQILLCPRFEPHRKIWQIAGALSFQIKRFLAKFKRGFAERANSSSRGQPAQHKQASYLLPSAQTHCKALHKTSTPCLIKLLKFTVKCYSLFFFFFKY